MSDPTWWNAAPGELAGDERLFDEEPDDDEPEEELDLCPECEHPFRLHTESYGCEWDRGDREGDESGPAYALGPCGCKYGIEDKEDDAIKRSNTIRRDAQETGHGQ